MPDRQPHTPDTQLPFYLAPADRDPIKCGSIQAHEMIVNLFR